MIFRKLSNDFGLERERFTFPLGAWDGLRFFFIVALPGPSI